MRIGIGFDVHAFQEGGDLFLGGVKVPYGKSLKGHSDADVLLHAICDAMLGALALGDIGKHFPPSDSKFKDISSIKLLEEVAGMVKGKGYRLGNLDCVIIAQEPKVAPFVSDMQKTIASTIGVEVDKVSVKATTTEGLGFTGRGEGIASKAIVLLEGNS